MYMCTTLPTAYETETSVLKKELKKVNSKLQEGEKLSQAKSMELKEMKVSLREKTASLSGMRMRCTSYSTIQ